MKTRLLHAVMVVVAAMFFGPSLVYGKPCPTHEKKDPPLNGTLVTLETFGNTEPCEVAPSTAPEGVPVVDVYGIDGLASAAPWVEFDGNFYHIEAEGLYRFIKINPKDIARTQVVRSVRNVIHVTDNQFSTISSRLELLSGLSKLHVHGSTDNLPIGEDPDTYLANLKIKAEYTQEFLSAECGYIAALGIKLIYDNLGKVTEARSISVQSASNLEYDTGHALMEVKYPATKQTILVDLDLGYIFYTCPTSFHGQPDLDTLLQKCHFLSAQEFQTATQNDKMPNFLPLSKSQIDTNYGDGAWLGWRLWSDYDKWGWYRQVFSGKLTEGPYQYPETSYSWKGPQGKGLFIGDRFWTKPPKP